jgi:hypothetical protein
VQKSVKQREERTLKTSVDKVKKESVRKKGLGSDCWYAQVFEPSYQFV